jgi:splicing factor 3B subunit 2
MERPSLTGHGDTYYEGKDEEFGDGMGGAGGSKFVSGVLSNRLKLALGIAEDASSGVTSSLPPPWLFNMQRYGPPPSYPRQKIPGLNAPIPAGAEFGYHPSKLVNQGESVGVLCWGVVLGCCVGVLCWGVVLGCCVGVLCWGVVC